MATWKSCWRPFFFLLVFSLAPFAKGAEATVRISYGKDPSQFAELRLPKGNGPFPVIILIHGGCWLSDYDLAYLDPLADWLTKEGFATWNIEYRRLGNPGGGWPGTFLDVGQAADALKEVAKEKPLNMEKVYASGHSAGGQLALWLASRRKIQKESPLFRENPLPISGVLGLDAITDLEQYRIGPSGSCHASVDLLLGGTPQAFPLRYQETSPIKLLPLGVPQIFIQGERDDIVDPASVLAYVEASLAKGDQVQALIFPGAGHFEAVTPDAKSIPILRKALQFLRE